MNGDLISYLIKEFSIKKEDFIEFLKITKRNMKGARTHIFVDNLKVHHTTVVGEAAHKNNQNLIFNGSCSSELNPIEFLWYLSKRKFRTEIMRT